MAIAEREITKPVTKEQSKTEGMENIRHLRNKMNEAYVVYVKNLSRENERSYEWALYRLLQIDPVETEVGMPVPTWKKDLKNYVQII